MKLKRWVEYLGRIEETASRNLMTEILAELLEETQVEEIDKLTYLMLGRLGPLYDDPQFNLAEMQIQKAISHASGKDLEMVNRLYKKLGDLGLVAQELGAVEVEKEITVGKLYDELLAIAKESGTGSQEEKIVGLANLLRKVGKTSAKYVVRIVLGKLRLGFQDKTVLDALSYMEKGDKSVKEKIELAYAIRPDAGWLVKTIKGEGLEKALNEKARVGVPIMPMLCQRLKTAKEMVKKMNKVAVEPKFDGTRVLIHFNRDGQGWTVKTFTRNLDENSAQFPELMEMAKHVNARELILDSEAVGYDPVTKKPVPFQLTITRKRKHGVEEQSDMVPLKFFVFDLIYKDGISLIDKSYEERRRVLKETILDRELLVVDDYWVTDDPSEIVEKHEEMIKLGLEGIIVKKIDSKYVPGRTGWRWVKMKEAEDSKAKLSDTLDCIVMGFGRGKGKRTQFGLGQFLIGIRDGERILTIAKIGTGLSDDEFRELKKRLDKIALKEMPKEYVVDEVLSRKDVDVWVEPKIVVEVAADEITNSPIHSAGVALRFPRLVKFREDKGVEQITTLEEVKSL